MWQALRDFLFPSRCPACGAYVEHKGDWCLECLEETLQPHDIPTTGNLRCFNGITALGRYRGPLGKLIRNLKYNGQLSSMSYIENLLQRAAWQPPVHDLLAVPVPLHRDREERRGFNQAELIFSRWLREKGVPLQRALVRLKATRPMFSLSPAERRDNLTAAFAVEPGIPVAGRSILLLDDIFTTGATVLACREALKAAEAASVYVLVLASDH